MREIKRSSCTELANLQNRFYDKQGLLTPSSRSDAGYRVYTEEDATQLHFILRAKAVGFSLVDIAELLSIELEKSNWACADVKKVVDIKLTDIESKMMELSHFRSSLQQLSDACCGGQISAEHCSILESLESNGDNIRIEKPDHQHR